LTALAGEGAIAIYRETTGLGSLDSTTSAFLSYDSVVYEGDTSVIEKNGGSPYTSFQLKQAGYYIVIYNLASEDNGGALRSEILTELALDGAIRVFGKARTYIRREEGCDEGYNHGLTIFKVTESVPLSVKYKRTDNNAGGNTRERSNLSSLTIVYLGEDLEMCQLVMDTNVQITSGGWTGVKWDGEGEVNTDAFAHSTSVDNEELTLKRAGRLYLVFVNTYWWNNTANRGQISVRATLNRVPLEHSYGGSYTRGTVDSCQDAVPVQAFLVDNETANHVLEIQVRDDGPSHGVAASNCALVAVCLPSTAKAILLHDTAGGTSCDTAGVEIPWDTEDRKDSDFGHSGSSDDVSMKRDGGDYLFLASVRNTRGAGVNRYGNLIEWRDGSTAYTRGSFGIFNRGDIGLNAAGVGGIVLYNVSKDDIVDLYMQDESTSAGTAPALYADCSGLCGLYLNSLYGSAGRLIDGGQIEAGNVGGRLCA
jgi:hypothetical protein